LAMLSGALTAMLAALLFGWFCVRLSGVYLAMLTLAFAQIVWAGIFQWDDLTGGSNGLVGLRPGEALASPVAYYYLALACAALGVYLLRRVVQAPFGLALRAWLARGGPQPGLLALLAHPVLQSAMQAMLESPQEDWPLPRLAGLCHMSRATFVRRFQEVGGTTPGEVLLQLRMARAARLLSYSKMGTAQIGEAVGYQSEAAFNRVFKKYSGLGPGAYRRRSRAAEAAGEEGRG
ncbi:helix-turn-helix domain-containing protein, partial [Herbaspirillum frisingense]|uniref:helix-turn-helix domain-containing protein n=1 Tax=Herbaspirillum frisingense TaxID=92645 RepID=UPI0039AFC601